MATLGTHDEENLEEHLWLGTVRTHLGSQVKWNLYARYTLYTAMLFRSYLPRVGAEGHKLWHQIWPPVGITCHIHPSAKSLMPAKFLDDRVPSVSWTTSTFFVPCRSKSACGRTNGQAVDSPHNVLTSSAFPDNALTNVSPNVVQSRISCEGRDHSVAAGRPTTFRNNFRNRTCLPLDDLQQNKPLQW